MRTLKGHTARRSRNHLSGTGAVTSVVFSPDEGRLASCDSAGTVRVWDAAGGLEMLTLKGLTGPAEEACRLDAENHGFQFLLAMAQYRLGQYQKALDMVAHTQVGSENYEYLAILAMANYRLGNTEQAQEFMNGMRQTVQYTRWDGNEDEQALMREAEALLQTPTEKPKK